MGGGWEDREERVVGREVLGEWVGGWWGGAKADSNRRVLTVEGAGKASQ